MEKVVITSETKWSEDERTFLVPSPQTVQRFGELHLTTYSTFA